MTKLLSATTFPWLLSNIIDKTTDDVPKPLQKYWVTERCGVRIGVIGLVEQSVLLTFYRPHAGGYTTLMLLQRLDYDDPILAGEFRISSHERDCR